MVLASQVAQNFRQPVATMQLNVGNAGGQKIDFSSAFGNLNQHFGQHGLSPLHARHALIKAIDLSLDQCRFPSDNNGLDCGVEKE